MLSIMLSVAKYYYVMHCTKSHKISSTSLKIVFWLHWSKTQREEENQAKEQVILHVDKLALYFLCFFVDIFTSLFDDFISMKFLIAVFLPVSPFIPTSPFINFGDFCQPPRLLHPPHLLFWLKFASLPVHSTLPFNLKLESTAKISWFRPPSGGRSEKLITGSGSMVQRQVFLKEGIGTFPI